MPIFIRCSLKKTGQGGYDQTQKYEKAKYASPYKPSNHAEGTRCQLGPNSDDKILKVKGHDRTRNVLARRKAPQTSSRHQRKLLLLTRNESSPSRNSGK